MEMEKERKLQQRAVARDIERGRWKYNGISFAYCACYHLLEDVIVSVNYTCDLMGITAQLTRITFKYPDKQIAIKTFAATGECIEWVTDALLQIKGTMTQRLWPYLNSKMAYERQVIQPIKLETKKEI